jgi:hypothetical protein
LPIFYYSKRNKQLTNNMKNIFSTETLKNVGAGVAGGASTLIVKKYALSKVPFLKDNEMYQDAATLVAGIAIGAFAKGSMLKTFGLGMSLVGGYNLVKPLVTKAGLGATDVLMGEIPMETGGNVLMGAVDSYSSSSFDTTSGEAGEMDF